jgi:hypothetical protein
MYLHFVILILSLYLFRYKFFVIISYFGIHISFTFRHLDKLLNEQLELFLQHHADHESRSFLASGC